MTENKWKLLLIIVIIISLPAAGYAAWQRHVLESNARSVALTVVYDEAAALARMNNMSMEDVLKEFKSSGVTGVLIKEPTLQDSRSKGDVLVFTGRELLLSENESLWRQFDDGFREEIKPDLRYLVLFDDESYQRIGNQLQAKKVPIRSWPAADTQGISLIETSYNWGFLEQLGLGFPKQSIDDVHNAGLNIYVQVRTWNQATEDGLTDVFHQLKTIPNLAGVLFNDLTLPGFPEHKQYLADLIKELDVPLIQIEFTTQKGFTTLGMLLEKNVVRLHTLSTEEDAKKDYDIYAMVDRFSLAATERNMRILLFHSYVKNDSPDILDMNLQLIEETKQKLEADGLQVGEASVLPYLHIPLWVIYIIGLGVIAGAALLVLYLGWLRIALFCGAFGLLAWTGLLFADIGPVRKLMALIAVIVFPTLAIMLNLRTKGSSIRKSVLLLLRISLYSLIGALLMVGLLADIDFMVKLDQFVGVKLAHVVPLALLALIFFFKGVKKESLRQKIQDILDQPVLVKVVMIGGVIMLALLIYLSRTGNESAVISPLELSFRNFLDSILGVRPRTKEFLLGHPLMLLLLYLGYKNNNYLPLLMGGAIGQISLINTYAHIHTPLAVSLLRSFHGLWLGILIGVILIAIWQVSDKFLKNYMQQTSVWGRLK